MSASKTNWWNLFELVEKGINEHGSASNLRERLELLRDHVRQLERENETLKSRLSEYEKELEPFELRRTHILFKGVWIKRSSASLSGIEILCPKCRAAMGFDDYSDYPACGCGYWSRVTESEIQAHLQEED